MNWIEVIGWVGNVLVITQFLQKDMMKLRIYGVLGATVWLVVAIMMNSLSLVVLNLLVVGIQLYHIRKIKIEQKKTAFDYPIIYQGMDKQEPSITVPPHGLYDKFPTSQKGWNKLEDIRFKSDTEPISSNIGHRTYNIE